MSLSVQTGIEAFDAHRNLANTSNQLASSMEKLSSGYRINKAADGLAISEKLDAQVSGLTQAQQNAQDAVNPAHGGIDGHPPQSRVSHAAGSYS
jgi:flagellin